MSAVPGLKRKSSTDISPAAKRQKKLPPFVDNSPTALAIAEPVEVEMSASFNKENQKGKAKKLVIKPFKVKPTLPEDFAETTWAKLHEAIRAVHESQPITTSLEELYRMCENMCSHKLSALLYERLEKECGRHILDEKSRLINQTSDLAAYLVLVDAVWQQHCQQMILIRQIFLVLDRTYVIQSPNIKSLWDMGLALFGGHIMSTEEILKKTVAGLLYLIECERNGDQINRGLMHSLLRMFDSLHIYADKFEVPFLDATNAYYASEGERCMAEMQVPTYLGHVEMRLAQENERVERYLDAATRKPLVRAVERHLLRTHVERILANGFDKLMDETRIPDLSRMYKLLARIQALSNLRQVFSEHVKKRGSEIVQNEAQDENMVQNILDFKERIDRVLDEGFQQNQEIQYSVKDSFESFINQRQNKPAELIAKHIDSKLRASGHKGASEEELATILDKLMVLFRYIQGKDVFEAFYKKDLAKRLLLQKSASFDAEKSMIAKLKQECGSSFTNKLEGMFKDIDLSSDIMNSFKQTQKSAKNMPIELYVNVLTMGFWPTYPPAEVTLPQELAECQNIFKTFYLGKHNGRKLMWQNSLGTCILKSNFPKGPKDLDVSLFQAVVLMLFNDADTLSFKEIKAATSIEDKELTRVLQSLACGKVKTRVLLKNPKGKDVEDTDSFAFNTGFTHELYRVKINQIQLKETVEENKQTNERVFQDRQYQVDAAIVRIMKTRKTLTHALLMAECFKQLKFPVKPADMKKRIESLIDREYLERDKTDSTVYHYLA